MCILLYLRASRSKNISKESVKIEGRHRGRGCRVISKANTRHKISKQNRKAKKQAKK